MALTHTPVIVGYSVVDCFEAPLLEVIEYHDVKFMNRFDQPSIFRGPPSADVETAWHDLWNRK